MTDEELRAAHKRSFRNKSCIETSVLVGCFYCKRIYAATHVLEWVRTDETALCPKCGIDAVIGDAAGIDLTPEFLKAMHEYWFLRTVKVLV